MSVNAPRQVNCTLCHQNLRTGGTGRLKCGHRVHMDCVHSRLPSMVDTFFAMRQKEPNYGSLDTSCCETNLLKLREIKAQEDRDLRPALFLCCAVSAILLVAELFACCTNSR